MALPAARPPSDSVEQADRPRSGTAYTVRALDRALASLDAFTLDHPYMTLADLTRATGLPKSTVFRLASTLVDRGYLDRRGDRYEIGLRCFQIGSLFRATIDIRARALPHLIELRDDTGETVQLAVLSGDQIVYIERVFSQRPVAYMRSTVGAVLPAYCTGLGKALLAYQEPLDQDDYLARVRLDSHTPSTIVDPAVLREDLQRTRQRGYALDHEEREAGVRCIAAPIFDMTGHCVAALSIASPAERLPLPLEATPLLPMVLRAAAAVSSALGHRGQSGDASHAR